MKKKAQKPISLKMPAQETFLPLASAFVSQSAKGLDLDPEAAEELALATEEVVAYLIGLGVDGREVTIDCTAGIELTGEGNLRILAGVVDMDQGNALLLPDTERTFPSGSAFH